ncbi:tetratricopeptide repeat protein [candidate division WOR-3 bacterium]|nr:tetratricopeptide repeat protein [candidate division WOR-3 bacterium]
MEQKELFELIKKLTEGYKGEEETGKRLLWLEQLLNSYKRYLPARIVERIKLDPSAKKIEGERRNITVAFADLSGFTSLSETMDAEDIANIINDFFTRMLKIVFKYEGSVDKFLGDALMVIFGAPVAHHDDPERAVRAALEMQQEMQQFNEKHHFDQPLAMSVGINTGPAVALNVGSEMRMEYTVIGDTVNLSARLEKVAQAGEIIISKYTYQHIADVVEADKRPSVRVKGKRKPIQIYLVKGMQEHYRLPDITTLKLIGRDDEVRTITSLLDRAARRMPAVVGIVGEPGSGKTRLGIETAVLAKERGFTRLNARCMPYTTNTPYVAVTHLLNDLFAIKRDANEEEKKLVISMKLKAIGLELDSSLPYIGVLYGIQFPQLQGIPPDELKKRIFDTVRQVIIKNSERAPILIRVEDLQWCDPTSSELLGCILDDMSEKALMFLFEYRSDYTFPWLKHPNYKNIALKNFIEAQVKNYATQVLNVDEVDALIPKTIFDKSQGNPLFVQEIVKYLLKKGGIRRYKGKAIVTNRFKKLEIAESISDVILAQIDRMSESERHVLQHASVIGKVFSPALLARVLHTPMEALQADLDRLEHFEGILTSSQEDDTRTYEFIAPTTYEVTYGSLLKNRRRELHTVIGNMIEQDHGERAPEVFEQLAYHFARSTNKGKGIHFSKLAAEKSYFLFALKESVAFFQQTSDLLGKKDLSTEETQIQMEVLRRQSLVLKILGDFEHALQDQKRSLRLAVKLDSPEDEARACINIGSFYQEMGTPEKGLNYFTRARRIAKKSGDVASQTMAVNNLGNHYLRTGDLDSARSYYSEVINLSTQSGDKRMFAFANQNLAHVAVAKGDLPTGLEFYKKAHTGFTEIGEKDSVARILNDIGMLNIQLGNIDAAMQKLNESMELAAKIGHKEVESLAQGNIGLVFAQTWRLDKAHEKFSQALTIAQMIGHSRQAMGMTINLGDIHLFRGNLQQALDYHEKAYELAQQVKDPINQALAQRSIAWDMFYTGNFFKAIQMFGQSQEAFQTSGDRRNGVLSMLGQAATRAHLGSHEEVLGMLKGLEEKARGMNDLEILANVLDIKADCLIALGKYKDARSTLEELPDLCRKIGNKRMYAWILAKQAYIALCENSIAGAGESMNKSMALAGEIGDTILFLHNSITNALLASRQENYTDSLNTLMEITEQARSCGAQEYLAKALWFTSQVFKKLGKTEEQKKYIGEYKKVIDNLTRDYEEPQKTMFLKTVETEL